MDEEQMGTLLQRLPERIRDAELAYYTALGEVARLKAAIQETKYRLIAENLLEGKNELQREASAWPYIKEYHERLLETEREADRLKADMYYQRNRFESLQALIRMKGVSA